VGHRADPWPQGYLRLGKIVRLQGKEQLAWQVYTAGIEVARADGRADDPKFRKLVIIRGPLHKRYYRMDVLALPRELVEQVFFHFDIHELR
jgi:F-box/TPR repeat protein Pof3